MHGNDNSPAHKSNLCVGGPLSGRRYGVRSGNGFSTMAIPKLTTGMLDPPGAKAPSDETEVEACRYREETFRTPDGAVHFWVPDDQTPLQSMTALLETFEQCKAERAFAIAALKDALQAVSMPAQPGQHLEILYTALRRLLRNDVTPADVSRWPSPDDF